MTTAVASLMAIMIASMTGRRQQDSAMFMQPNLYNSESKIGADLWLHIALILDSSLYSVQRPSSTKGKEHSLLITFKIITLITVSIGTVLAFWQHHKFHSSSLIVLGYLAVLLLVAYLSIDVWHKYSSPSKPPNEIFNPFQ
jgi:hypothetical protein